METTLKLNLLFLDFFPVLFCVRGNNIFLILTKPFFFFFFTNKNNYKEMSEQFVDLQISMDRKHVDFYKADFVSQT